MAQLPLQRGGSLPSPEVRIYTPATSVPTPGLATGPPVFVSPTLTSSSGRSTPRQAFMPTQMLVPGATVKVTAPTESKDAAPAPVQPAPAQAAVAPAVSAGPTPPQLPVPSSRDRSKSPRKARSRISVSQPMLGGGLPQRIQGISCCTLCHALLQIFAGKVRIQTFQSSSDLPAPPAHLVDRALNYELSEGEDVDASDSFCRLHLLHKNRYELWLKGQDAIRRCSARGDAQATLVIRGCAEEMGKLDSVAGKVEQEYLEAYAAFFKQLQQDVRENLFKTLMGKADELVSAWQEEIKEVNQQIDKKVQQKRTQLRAAVHRRHENAKEDFWRQHEKHCAQQFVSCLVDNCRNMHIGRANYASTAFKELEISQQARRPITEKSVEGRAQSRADQERARRQREMNIWLGKMDQLQTLQHLQACKDRELVYLRVAMTIRRLEEDQGVEHRLVLNRVSQHLQQMRLFLEKTLRASGVSSCLDLMGVTPGSIVLEQESFIHMVLRNERILGDVTAIASPRGASSLNRSQCQGISASFGSGSRGGKGADQMGASLELRAFGEFLGARFPSLRAALSAMDITGTGRVACFELESWLRQQMYPGNARMLLKDLGRKGSLGMAQLRFLAPAFVRQSDPRGRPGGATAAALVRSLWQSVDSKARQYQPLEAQQAAIRCCRCVFSFLDDAVVLSPRSEQTPRNLNDTAKLAGTGRLGDQGLDTFQSVLTPRSRKEGELSLASASGRRVTGEVEKRVSAMHYRRSDARPASEKHLPRQLRPDHLARRDAELKRLSPALPTCIATIRGRNKRLASPPRSQSNSPRRSHTGSPIRRLLDVPKEAFPQAFLMSSTLPASSSTLPPPATAATAAGPATGPAVAVTAEVEQGEKVVRRRSQPRAVTQSLETTPTVMTSLPLRGPTLVRSPSAPPVILAQSAPGALLTPRTLTPQASLGKMKELSPRVHWEADSNGGAVQSRVATTTSVSPRSMISVVPAVPATTYRISTPVMPNLVKAQSLPTTPLQLQVSQISQVSSAGNSPRFFVQGSSPTVYRSLTPTGTPAAPSPPVVFNLDSRQVS